MKEKLLCCIAFLVMLTGPESSAQWQNGLWTQKQAYNWYFCMNAGLNFAQVPPVPLTDGNVAAITGYQTDEDGVIVPDTAYQAFGGSSVMSDAAGNLLFYTDGNIVWNKNHQVMINGTDLLCAPWGKQNTIIVPAPGNSDKYYIFSIKEPNYYTFPYPFPIGNPLYSWRVVYTEVDMALDNGLGGVTSNKNVILDSSDEPNFLAGSYYGRITATYHSDGNQIWVMLHGIANNEFRAFLVSDSGVNSSPVISAIGASYDGYPDTMAQMKFSPDGTKIVKSLMLYDEGKNVEVFNFDKNTGQVTGIVVTLGQQEFINDGELAGAQGLEFSPNSKLLYTTGVTSGVLKQFNLEAGDEEAIRASGIALSGSADPIQFNHYMQVAQDGKIYIAFSEDAYGGFGSPMALSTINVIDFPNNIGAGAGFNPNAIDLGNGKSAHCFPSFIQDYFASGILHEGNCEGFATNFSTLRIPGITSITWDFGDPGSGTDNQSTNLEPIHTFSGAGVYTVKAVIISNGSEQTATTEVTILPAPNINVPPAADLTSCADSSGKAAFDLTSLDGTILGEQGTVEYSVTYYASLQDMEAGNEVVTPEEFVTEGQLIYAVITNIVTGCTSTTPLNLVVNAQPMMGNPINIEECGNASSLAIFDLTHQIPVILGDLNQQDYGITFHRDPELTDVIQQPAMFESAGETLYTTLTNLLTGCYATKEFNLLVLPEPSLPGTTTFKGCSPFDLAAIAGEPDEGTIFSFYTNENDALENVNAITNTSHYIVKDNSGKIYVRVQDDRGCFNVGAMFLESGDCFIPRGISPNGDGMNDNFNLSGFDVKLLTIFNRYGQEVYSKDNYSNEWTGQSSAGEDLPSGTYYYMIESNDGNSVTGWVYINRQE